MKKIILLLAFLTFGITKAQNIKYEGILKDSTNVGIETANVMAVNQTTKAMDAYNITNDKGRFMLSLKPNTSYLIKAGYIGYAPFQKIIKTGTTNIIEDITLKSENLIDAVEIVKEMPVTIKGDTIIYNSDSFTNGTEKKLEDIIKKLPGMSINKDGEIVAEGKTAKKLMIDGKDFFDGDTKLATKNIPADAVDKVQVLRNYNEVSNLKGLENNQDDIAINIKLKKGKSNFWFGDVTAGSGVGNTTDRYMLNPKLFYYSPKYSVNLIGNFNNLGELPLTMQDYFKFSGGFKNIMRKGGSSFNVVSNDLGLGLRNNKALNIETKFGAANFSYNPNKKLTFSGFGIFSYNNTDIFTESSYLRNDKLPNGTLVPINNFSTENSNQKTKLGLFKFSTSYIPSTKKHFDYDLFIKTSNQIENQNTVSTLQGNIKTDKKQQPFSINQNLNYYYTLNDKNVFAFELQNLYQTEDPLYTASLSKGFLIAPPAFSSLNGYNNLQNNNNGNQDKFVKTNKTDVKVDYYYSVTPKANLNITLANTYSYQNFNSNIFQILNNGTVNNLTNSANTNDVTYQFNDAFLGLHYKFLLGKFTFNPGFSVHQFNTKDMQLNSSAGLNFTRVLPDFYAMWQLKKSESITYNFSLTNSFTDINKIAQGYIFSNFNSLFNGNRFLENAISQVHRISYFKYSMFNQENISASISYNKLTNIISNKFQLVGINQSATPVNLDSNLPNETINGFFNYGRAFLRYFKAEAKASLNINKNNNVRTIAGVDTFQTNESITQDYGLGFSTNLKNLPNLSFDYNFNINKFGDQTFYVDNPEVTLEYFFLEAFSFKSEYSFYHNQNKEKTIDTEYDFLSVSLNYRKKDSKMEFTLAATNLLNTKSLNESSFNQVQNATSFSAYYVQPRYITFTMKYNL